MKKNGGGWKVNECDFKKVNVLRPGMRGVNVKVQIGTISEPLNVNLITGEQSKVVDAHVLMKLV